jgi:hypothetical protein
VLDDRLFWLRLCLLLRLLYGRGLGLLLGAVPGGLFGMRLRNSLSADGT